VGGLMDGRLFRDVTRPSVTRLTATLGAAGMVRVLFLAVASTLEPGSDNRVGMERPHDLASAWGFETTWSAVLVRAGARARTPFGS
jgi:hypothetical protein